MRRALLIATLVASALVLPGATAAVVPRVTVIGDSIATEMLYIPAAKRLLERGVDIDYELAVCRRLAGESCSYKGLKPPTLVDLASTTGLPPVVVVATGYNDYLETFPQSVEAALNALRKAGVQKVLWLTLRAERASYIEMNDALRAAARQHDELTIVDWNEYSRSHPDWFQDDGLHLGYGGAVAMATLVHRALQEAGAVEARASVLSIATRKLPPASLGRPYGARLSASGGTRPIRWAQQAGTLPPGLRLRADGRLTGIPRAAGRFAPTVRATAADGRSTTRRLLIVVTRG